MRLLSEMSKERWLVVGFVLAAVLFALLPALLFAPDWHQKGGRDFPHSGFVGQLTATDFTLAGKQERRLHVTYTASTTVAGGGLVEGQFVQVFGHLVEPGTIAADRIQVLGVPQRP